MEIHCPWTLLLVFMIASSVTKIVVYHSDLETMGYYNSLETSIDYFSQSKLSTIQSLSEFLKKVYT